MSLEKLKILNLTGDSMEDSTEEQIHIYPTTSLKQRLEKAGIILTDNESEDSSEDSVKDSMEDATEDSMDDSTEEQYIERKIHKMGEKQISDKEVENISTENTLKKEQTVSSPFLPSYIKRCSQTDIKSTIFDYTWTIEQYTRFSMIKHMISSFPEIGQCEILMNVLRDDSSSIKGIKLNILTNNSFHGSCETTIKRSSGEYIFSKFISGHISNMTLLIEYLIQNYGLGDTLIINCKFEIFCNLINKTIHMDLLTSPTKLSKDVTYFEDPSFNKFEYKDEGSIKFIIGGKPHVVSKKSLCAISSSYFKKLGTPNNFEIYHKRI
ncbi:uncharacterized protein [Temnothorax longispinosus]|uniref:uncharacterized protein isoform X2 n=1 Tax=Temnothorax longispinosus TaxID=300112 RepID=UPI003A98DBCE